MAVDKGYQPGIDPVMTLTPREKQVFYMLLEGMKAKEIGFERVHQRFGCKRRQRIMCFGGNANAF